MLTDLTTSPAIISALGTLLSAGAIAWFIRSGTNVVLAQRDAVEARKDASEARAKATVLESRVNQQDTIISEIRGRLAKLDQIDGLVAAAQFIQDAVKQMVPRAEQEAKWLSLEQRFARIEADLRSMQDHSAQGG